MSNKRKHSETTPTGKKKRVKKEEAKPRARYTPCHGYPNWYTDRLSNVDVIGPVDLVNPDLPIKKTGEPSQTAL